MAGHPTQDPSRAPTSSSGWTPLRLASDGLIGGAIGGVVFFDSERDQDVFLKWADAAMCKAKELGGKRIVFHVAPA
jgi:GGDEF domain-containing protein